MTYKAWNLPYNEISYISYLSLSKHLFWVIESLYSLNWCFLKNSMHFLSILRRVRLCHILPSYINFFRGYYSINSSNAVFATILIAPLPIRSYNDSKYVLTNRSRKEKNVFFYLHDEYGYLCEQDTRLLFVGFLEYILVHHKPGYHNFPWFHRVRIDVKIDYHCPTQHATNRLKLIPLK